MIGKIIVVKDFSIRKLSIKRLNKIKGNYTNG